MREGLSSYALQQFIQSGQGVVHLARRNDQRRHETEHFFLSAIKEKAFFQTAIDDLFAGFAQFDSDHEAQAADVLDGRGMLSLKIIQSRQKMGPDLPAIFKGPLLENFQ